MDPLLRGQGSKKPTVVDIREGWYFGYKGSVIKESLVRKIDSLQVTIQQLLSQIESEVGNREQEVAALLVALHAEDMNPKARYIKSMCERIVVLMKKRTRLVSATKGFTEEMIYILSLDDMEEIGL